jgi:hypothetical protein
MSLSKPKLFAYGFSAIGINLLNLVMGIYLCHALYLPRTADGVIETAGANFTFMSKDLVIIGIWGVVITIAKIVDGVIDVPLANLVDRLNFKIGKRKSGLLLGFIPMTISFLLFLFIIFKDNLTDGNLWVNTVWFGVLLILFYCSYTCSMLAYYGSFAEVTKNDSERTFLANIKSVADVFSYVIVYALVPVLNGVVGENIRIVALMIFPLSFLLFIAIFLLKEKNSETTTEVQEKEPGMIASIVHVFKNKNYMVWMGVFAFMTFGIQFFLVGLPEFFSKVGDFSGGQIAMINAAAFAPVPLTIALYNFVIKKKGLRFGYTYAMIAVAIGMVVCSFVNKNVVDDAGTRLIIAIIGSVLASFGIGTFFSVTYIIPSHCAAVEKEQTGKSQPSMYFAVQGLIGAVVTAFSTGIIMVHMRTNGLQYLMMAAVALTLLLSCVVALFLPKSIALIGKKDKSKD